MDSASSPTNGRISAASHCIGRAMRRATPSGLSCARRSGTSSPNTMVRYVTSSTTATVLEPRASSAPTPRPSSHGGERRCERRLAHDAVHDADAGDPGLHRRKESRRVLLQPQRGRRTGVLAGLRLQQAAARRDHRDLGHGECAVQDNQHTEDRSVHAFTHERLRPAASKMTGVPELDPSAGAALVDLRLGVGAHARRRGMTLISPLRSM